MCTQNSTENPNDITMLTTVTAEIQILKPEINTFETQSRPNRLKLTKNTQRPTKSEIPKFVMTSIANMTAAIANKVSSNSTPLMQVY